MVISIHLLFSEKLLQLDMLVNKETVLDFFMYLYFSKKNITKRILAYFSIILNL